MGAFQLNAAHAVPSRSGATGYCAVIIVRDSDEDGAHPLWRRALPVSMSSSGQEANPTNCRPTAGHETVINSKARLLDDSMSGRAAAPHVKTSHEVKFCGIHETKTSTTA